MLKKFFSWEVALFFFGIVIVCGIAFNLMGSYVDEQGILHEPFAFIPIAWLSFLLGLISGGGFLIQRLVTRFLR